MKKIREARLNPMRAKWPALFTLLSLFLAGLYLYMKMWLSDEAAETLRIFFGILGVVMIVYLSAFRIRKLMLTRRVGSMNSWSQAHMYIGLMSVLIILIHIDFKAPGVFGGLLTFLFAAVILSGVVTGILYRIIPVWLSKQGVDALELDERRKHPSQYLDEAEAMAERASVEFRKFFKEHVRIQFVHYHFGIFYLLREEMDVIKLSQSIFNKLYHDVPPADRHLIKDMEILYTQREKMEFKWARLQALRWWLMTHVPINAALLTALAFHLGSVAYY